MAPQSEKRPTREFFVNEYLNKRRSALSIAKQLGVGETTIFRWMDSYGMPRRTSSENQNPLYGKEPSREELIELHHQKHISINSIAEKFNTSWGNIQRLFKKHGIKIKSHDEIILPKDFVKPSKNELRKLYYDDNLSTKQIAKKFDRNSSTIRSWLYKNNIQLKKTIPDKFPHNYWSKETIINRIKNIHHENGDLSAKFCSVHRRKLFQATLNYFGSWKNGVNASGLDYTKVLRIKQWTEKEILNEIKWSYNKGINLSHKNIIKINKKLITASENNFGSWAKAVQAAGIDYYGKVAINKNKYWTKEKIIDQIKSLYSKEKDLSFGFVKNGEYGGLLYASIIKFGSWENALQEAGIDYQKISKLKAQTKSFKAKLRAELTKEKLQELYVEKRLSTIEIGLIYGVSPNPITVLLKKNNIELNRPKYGYKKLVVCKDGHKVKSNLERNVCDWLHEKGIEHEYEPKYHKSKYYGNSFKADFKIGKFNIEILGMLGIPKYEMNFEKKTTQFMMVGGAGSACFKGEDYELYKNLIDKENKDVIVIVEPKKKILSKEEITRQIGFLIPLFSKNQKNLTT